MKARHLFLSLSLSIGALALECNICGPGNIIGNPQGVVSFEYDGEQRKQNCRFWQESEIIDEKWCEENMLQYTMHPCKCLTADGSLLLDQSVGSGSAASGIYQENGHEVKVYVEPLADTENDDLSNKKCVEYLVGGTSDMSKACFDTVYNVNGVFVDCELYYNDVPCNSCTPCVSADVDGILGFNLDCNNILPSKTTLSSCPPLNDGTIQQYLTNAGDFVATQFVFAQTRQKANGSPYSGAVTAFMDPYIKDDCYFEDNSFPHTLNQCECFGTIETVPEDTLALYHQLRPDVEREVYNGTFVEPDNSCHPANQALLWLSSGNNRDAGGLYTRFVLAVSYYAMNGTRWDSSDSWLSEKSECEWFGLQCNNLYELHSYVFNANNVHGTIPTEMGYLRTLHNVSITRNHLIGTIPEAILRLPNLEVLQLGANALVGTLPPSISLARNLKILQLNNNLFFGTLATELGKATMLEEFSVAFNEFIKPIPTELGRLEDLKHLNLEENRFSGTFASEIGLMASLEVIRMSNNLLHGTIPTSLSQIGSLKDLRLANTGLGGTLSTELTRLSVLQRLDLSKNQFTGSLVSEFGLMGDLSFLALNDNDFSGTIPTELGNLINMTHLSLSGCLLTGTVPSEIGRLMALESIELDKNKLTGTVPQEVCDLRQAALDLFVTDCSRSDGRGVVCPIPDCCTLCRRTGGQDPPVVEVPGPTEPVTLNEDLTLEDCISDLVASDRNQDLALHQNEYLGFLQALAKRYCVDVYVLSLEQKAAFNAAACLCLAQPDASADCCLGSQATIQLNGTLDQELTEVSKDYFRNVCKLSSSTLPAPQCHHNSTTCNEESHCPSVTCDEELAALEHCFADQAGEPHELQSCVTCNGLQSLFNMSEGEDIRESVCEINPKCEDSCGTCFEQMSNLTRCVWDCNATNGESWPPLHNSTSPNSTLETLEPELAHNETEPPALDDATGVPNATISPVEEEQPTVNSTTMPPTLPNSTDNIFDRQPEEAKDRNDEPPYGQNVSVVLNGLERLLSTAEQADYVDVTQAFVQMYDPSVQVEFAGQKLIESSSSGRRRRAQAKTSSALEVTTRMTSQEDEAPGETASDILLVHSTSYVQILQHTSETFGTLQTVEVLEETEPAFNPTISPTVVTPQGPTASPQQNKDKKKKDSLFWWGIGLVVLSVLLTIIFFNKLLKMMTSGPVANHKRRRRNWDENSVANDLDDSAMRDLDHDSKDDDRKYRFDQDQGPSSHHRPSSSQDNWVCEPGGPRQCHDADSSEEDDEGYWSPE